MSSGDRLVSGNEGQLGIKDANCVNGAYSPYDCGYCHDGMEGEVWSAAGWVTYLPPNQQPNLC